MILPIYSVVRLIDPRLSEAAATLGATPLHRFVRVTLPLTLPGIVSGIAFVFSLAVSMYGRRRAARPRGRDRGRIDGTHPSAREPDMTVTERAAGWLVWIVATAAVVFLLTPLVVTVAVSFGSSPVFTLPPPAWSTRWYERLWASRDLWPAVLTSLRIAALSTAAALVLGTLCAIAVVRSRFPGREALVTFLVSPLMLPGLVIGIAMLQGYRAIGLRDVGTSLLVAHVVITLPYVVRTVVTALSLFDFTLIDAARTLGLAYPAAILRVLVPSLAPAFLTSGLFAFLASMDNYPISIVFTDAWTEYATRAGWPRIRAVLRRHGVAATLSASGRAIALSPWLAEEAVQDGHEVAAHGWRWESHAHTDENQEREAIARTVAAIRAAAGTAPVGWHTRSTSSVNTRRLLVEHGASSTTRMPTTTTSRTSSDHRARRRTSSCPIASTRTTCGFSAGAASCSGRTSRATAPTRSTGSTRRARRRPGCCRSGCT